MRWLTEFPKKAFSAYQRAFPTMWGGLIVLACIGVIAGIKGFINLL